MVELGSQSACRSEPLRALPYTLVQVLLLLRRHEETPFLCSACSVSPGATALKTSNACFHYSLSRHSTLWKLSMRLDCAVMRVSRARTCALRSLAHSSHAADEESRARNACALVLISTSGFSVIPSRRKCQSPIVHSSKPRIIALSSIENSSCSRHNPLSPGTPGGGLNTKLAEEEMVPAPFSPNSDRMHRFCEWKKG